ncbi:MAG: hypothetical protein A2054_06525 [Deltaproteobacteria bacterium GWA2_55_10]|nr:MAG: hypothetical protein A2054_06525 [Deltaproteobacteria bacterium GWA2_55_10]
MPPQLHHAGSLVSLDAALEASQSPKTGMAIEGLERGLGLHDEDLTVFKLNVSSFQRALNAEKPRQIRLKKDSWVKIYPHKTAKSQKSKRRKKTQ